MAQIEQREQKLSDWTNILEERLAATSDVSLEDVENAFAHITEADDRGLFGLCNFYRAYYCMQNGMPGETLKYLNEAIRCMLGTAEEKNLARCYNLLGIVAHSRNNFLLAAEQYNKSLSYAAKYEDAYIRNIAGANLADIYYRLGIYDKAFWWYRESMSEYEKSGGDNAIGAENYMMLLSGYGFCLAMSGRLKEAEEVCDKLERMKSGEYGEYFPELCAYTFFALLYYKKQREEIASACLNVAIQSVLEDSRITRHVDSIQNLLDLLIMMNKYGYLGELLDNLEKSAKTEGNEGLLMQILAYQLKYCGDKMTQEQYLERTANFFSIKEEYEIQENEMFLQMMEMRAQLFQIEDTQKELRRENMRLRYQADHDELSGLYNKGKLHLYAEEVLDVAKKSGYALSTLFVDIDYFKEMNDYCGHGKGDDCVRAVAKCICQCMPNEFAARYGGDEFVIIALDRTEEYVRKCGEEIIRAVRALNIPNKGAAADEVVTVTVGVVHAVPAKSNKAWDFFAAADEALYRQKNEKRGCMRFSSRVGLQNGK